MLAPLASLASLASMASLAWLLWGSAVIAGGAIEGTKAVEEAAATVEAPSAISAPLIPRRILFGNPERSSLKVSDDGSMLGWLAPHQGVLNIWVQDLVKGARTGSPRPITESRSRPIKQWEFLPGTGQVVFLLDDGGDEDFRLFAADVSPDAHCGSPRCLTPWADTRTKLLAVDARHPGEVLIASNRRDPATFDVCRLRVATGEAVEVFRNDAAWFDMLADGDWNIRLVRRFLADGSAEARYRPSPQGEWELLRHWGPEDAGPSKPLAVSADGRAMFVADTSSPNTGETGGLFEVTRTATGELNWRLLAADEKSEPRSLLVEPSTGNVLAVSFEFAKARWQVVDKAAARDIALLRTIGDGVIEITSRTSDGRIWTIQHNDARTGLSYWIYHREANGGRTERLFVANEALVGLPLQAMEPHTIRSRDGMELLSYLTLPPGFGRGRSAPVPMVLHVHGGPWTRDVWGFHPIHQWLANRGYAVLSVNFRGSTGFGKRFMNAGDRQWSQAMQNDLLDAVDWAIAQGIADREKVAIMGQSYGGYATLVGLTFTPTRFACGVDIVGPVNLLTLLDSIPAYWAAERGMLDRRVGRIEETEWLESISPLSKVDALARPLLIGQGANDPRVPRAESDQIVRAAQARQIPVTYVVFPDEGHGFARPENRMAFMAIAEAFLARQLGGRAEPIGDDVERSSAVIEAGSSGIQLPGAATHPASTPVNPPAPR
jgi:dipeptidyl aminopeptidase/acylaminoacyl peptidase